MNDPYDDLSTAITFLRDLRSPKAAAAVEELQAEVVRLREAVKKQSGKSELTFAYADVAEKIADAETGDALDAAEDLIGAVADPAHQLELRKLAKERRESFV